MWVEVWSSQRSCIALREKRLLRRQSHHHQNYCRLEHIYFVLGFTVRIVGRRDSRPKSSEPEVKCVVPGLL